MTDARMYGSIAAETYDELTGSHQRAVLKAIRSLAIPAGRAIDVGCGTGALVRALNSCGWRAHGIDASEDMVRAARRLGPRGAFAVGEATSFRARGGHDLVTATFDVANHLITSRRLSSFFASACRALRPGGVLLFDAVTPYDINRNWDSYLQYTCRPGWRLVRYGRRVRPSTGEIVYDFFLPRGGGAWTHHREMHRLHAWSRRDIAAMLRDRGFCRVRCVDAASLGIPRADCVRWMFTAKRGRDR